MTEKELCQKAITAMKNSYAPYSSFNVGAALLAKDGKVFTGCNIENAAYSPTVCAERTAIFKAVSEGEREFSAIAISGGANGKIQNGAPPCGVCRQVMAEFCSPDFKILVVTNESGEYKQFTLKDLLPEAFDLVVK